MKQAFVIAGIHTGAGKSFVSGILCSGLGFAYWKPVQTGSSEGTDTDWIRSVVGIPESRIFQEAYCYRLPASPHLAAAAEGEEIDATRIQIPATDRGLIIELAGGLMVPLNNHTLMIDLLAIWKLPVLLVVPLYLGSINHALLSLEALQHRQIPVAGMIFNEGDQPDGARAIAEWGKAPVIGQLPRLPGDQATIARAFEMYLKDGWLRAGLAFDGPAAS